jgi:hypothetical protein
MTYSSQKTEIDAVANRLFDSLSLTISSRTGSEGASLRRQLGELRAFYVDYLHDGTLLQKLLDYFTAATNAGAKLISFFAVHENLFKETPVGDISSAIVQASIVYCMSAESRIIVKMEFTSRNDVENMIRAMKAAFDTARDLASDAMNTESYMALTSLAGSLTSFLGNASRPLPNMVAFHMAKSYPALSLSNRIYYTASRYDEIIKENHIIHPAFCMNDIVGLSK